VIPTNLQHLGFSSVNSDYVVRNAALVGLPLSFIAAWMYGFWRSKKTIIVLSGFSTVTLLWFAIAGDSLARNHALLTALLVLPWPEPARWWRSCGVRDRDLPHPDPLPGRRAGRGDDKGWRGADHRLGGDQRDAAVDRGHRPDRRDPDARWSGHPRLGGTGDRARRLEEIVAAEVGEQEQQPSAAQAR